MGKVANGITTVHLSYVRERTGHALIGARQWIPAEHISDPVCSLVMGLPDDLVFRTKGELAIDIAAEALADGVTFDFVCGDEVYGACTKLRDSSKAAARPTCCGFRAAFTSHWHVESPAPAQMWPPACSKIPAAGRSAPPGKGSKGERWYAWALVATASPRHHLLIRRHLKTGELAFHYCYLPPGQPVSKTQLIRRRAQMAGGRGFRVRQGLLRPGPVPGPPLPRDRPPHRAGHGRAGDCAVTAALLLDRTNTQAPPPARPSQPPPADPGMIPLTIPEITRLLTTSPARPGHVEHWSNWRRRHQARSRWYHQRTRLTRDTQIALVS